MIYEAVITNVESSFSIALLTINPTWNAIAGNTNLSIKRGLLIVWDILGVTIDVRFVLMPLIRERKLKVLWGMTCSHVVTLACIRHPTSIRSPSVSNPAILSPARRYTHVRKRLDNLLQLLLTANLPNPQHSDCHPTRKFPFGYTTITPSARDVCRGVNYVRIYQLLLILRYDCHHKSYILLFS